MLLVAAAYACSCLEQPLTRELVAADAEFPTNGLIRVFLDGEWPKALRPQLATEYRLRGPDGALVPLRARVDGATLILGPERELTPNARYVIERLYAYGDGRLLTDDERWDLTVGPRRRDADPPPAEIVRVWFSERVIVTTAGPDTGAPPTPGVLEARYGAARGGGDCGPGEAVGADLDTTGLHAGDTLGLEVRGHGLVWSGPYRSGTVYAGASDMLCAAPKVHIDVRRPPQVRAVAWSAAGERSKASPWVTATAGRDDLRLPDAHKPRPEPDGAAFLAVPVVEAERAPVDGACGNGLATSSRYTVPGIWSQRRPNLLRAGDHLWLLRADAEERNAPVAAVELSLDGVTGAPVVVGTWRDTVVATEGPVPLVVGRRDDEDGLALTGLGPDGVARWAYTLPGGWRSWHVVGGGPRLLVVYERPRRTESREEVWPAWVVLDAATGAEVGHGDLGALGPATSVAAYAWDGAHFVVTWSWDRAAATPRRRRDVSPAGVEGAWMALVNAEGAVDRSFALPDGRLPHALVPATDGWLLSWRTELTRLDHEGKQAGDTVIVPDAVVPSLAQLAPLGEDIVVGGDSPFADAGFAVLTPGGGVSPAYRIHGLNPELAVLDGTLLSAFGVADQRVWHIAVETYTCRDEPPVGPPSRLGRP